MKKSIIIAFIISFTTANAQVKEAETASNIQGVTVFFNGAQVERKASMVLNPGTNIIRLSKLSPYIDPNSIQVEGSNKYTIVSVNHRKNYLNETEVNPELLVIKNKIEDLSYQIELNRTDIVRLDEEKAIIDANKSIWGQNKSITVDDMMDMSELYQNQYKNILVEQIALTKKEKEIQKSIQKLQMQYNSINNATLKNTTDIIVNISAATRLNAEIRFTYVVTNAAWSPSYDAKATDVKNPFSLTYKAKVVQTTGEDWKNIKLTLSTGNPSKNNTLPNLYTWELSGYDWVLAEKKRKENEEKAKRDNNNRNYAYGGEPAPVTKSEDISVSDGYAEVTLAENNVVSTATYTTVTQTSVNTEFEIAIPYTVISDGKEYSVEIKQVTLDAKYRYYSAPKYDKSAFLISYISGWDKLNLISGMANVYFQDSYVGQSWLETQVTMDSLQLSLGRDRSVIVERTKIKDYSKPNITGSTKKVTIGIELVIKNTKSNDIILDLEDQIPVSKNKEIVVEMIDEAGATLKPETGGLFWVLNLKAGETKKITFVYSVKYPKDKDLDTF